jgi:hypothetical protein
VLDLAPGQARGQRLAAVLVALLEPDRVDLETEEQELA